MSYPPAPEYNFLLNFEVIASGGTNENLNQFETIGN
jgi:hypothetical protein